MAGELFGKIKLKGWVYCRIRTLGGYVSRHVHTLEGSNRLETWEWTSPEGQFTVPRLSLEIIDLKHLLMEHQAPATSKTPQL